HPVPSPGKRSQAFWNLIRSQPFVCRMNIDQTLIDALLGKAPGCPGKPQPYQSELTLPIDRVEANLPGTLRYSHQTLGHSSLFERNNRRLILRKSSSSIKVQLSESPKC